MPVIYAFGWMPSLPDFRDVQFAFQPLRSMLASLPVSVNLTSPALGVPWDPTWDQQPLGSCGLQCAGADIVFALIRQQGIIDVPMPSRLFMYYNTRSLMGTINQDSGVDNRTMLKALAMYGWCDEALWPYDISRYREKPPQACYDQAANRKIAEYNSVAQDLQTMKACLAGGDPFIFGFTVYSSMQTAEVERTGVVPMPRGSDRVAGGHDVLFVGYDDSKQRFKFRNSWSAQWGENGYGWMPYGYVSPRLSSDYWTVKKSPWPGPPVPPPPPPVPPVGLAPQLIAQDATGRVLGKYLLTS